MKITNQNRPALPTAQTPVGQTSASQSAGIVSSEDVLSKLQSSQTGQVHVPGPITLPEPVGRELSAEQLKLVAGVGGAGIFGHGKLSGEIVIATRMRQDAPGTIGYEEKVASFVTANKGTRSQVSFTIDLPIAEAEKLVGQVVELSGEIEKTSMYGGRISNVKAGQTFGVKPGSYGQVSGTIENRQLFGIGGEAPPSGSWLKLAQPITIGGESVSELYIGQDYGADGASMKLNGRFDKGSWGGVETHGGSYYRLTGVTNVGKGEPAFDGKTFTSSVTGEELDRISWTRPEVTDIPATIWVLDPQQEKAFVGSMGGFIPPWMNPFHGIRDVRAIEVATEDDRKSVAFDPQGVPYIKASGDKLSLISVEEPPPGTADMFTTSWYIDPKSDTLYRFQSGGIAGFINRMDALVRGPAPAAE